MGRLGRLVVVLTLSLICFISYSSQIFVIWPWYGGVLSVELLTLLVPFNILVAMLLWNYYLCVVTDPGRVPTSWKPDFESTDGYEVKKLTGGPRFCRSCDKYKPPRTHHCRQCNRCVLRMDHHCPWINNCVGHFNYGHFIRFLCYVDLACSYHLTMIIWRVVDAARTGFWDEPTTLELVFSILNFTFCVPILLVVGAFSIYHLSAMFGNTTTIESREKDRVATLVRRGKLREIKFPYNLGMRRNIESVLGNNPLLWSCPTVTPGTGLKYQLVQGDDTPLPWPPQDPTHSNQNSAFALPPSPWTYENNSLNPNLQPYNSQLRSSDSRRRISRKAGPISSVPPYHPDHQSLNDDVISAPHLTSSDSETSGPEIDGYSVENTRIRRGSEGYEVRSVDREEMLQRYLQDQAMEPGRYQVYIPEPESESDINADADPE